MIREWEGSAEYRALQHHDAKAAGESLEWLRGLRQNAGIVLETLERMSAEGTLEVWASKLTEDQEAVLGSFDQALRKSLYGYDEHFVVFVTIHLSSQWVFRFGQVLKDPGEEGTRAWRAHQLLWQRSIQQALAELGEQNELIMGAALEKLQAWQQRLDELPTTVRDDTGTQPLEAALSRVADRLATVAATVDRVDQKAGKILERLPAIPKWDSKAYAAEICDKYEYWEKHYVPLSARVEQARRSDPVGGPTAPARFQPVGFRVSYRRNLGDRKDEQTKSQRPEPRYFDDVVSALLSTQGAVLLGQPGAGKTTSLWRLMLGSGQRCLGDEQSPIPVLVSLAPYDGRTDLLDFVKQQLAAEWTGDESQPEPLLAHRQLGAQLEREWSNYSWVFLLDGLNEVRRDAYSQVLKRIGDFRFVYCVEPNRLVLACRTDDYNHAFQLDEIEIQRLDNQAIRSYVLSNLGASGAELLNQLNLERLWDLAAIPYLLALMVHIYGEMGTLPRSRAQLFTDFIDALLRREYRQQPEQYRVSAHVLEPHRLPALLETLSYRWSLLSDWSRRPHDYGLESLSREQFSDFVVQSGLLGAGLGGIAYSLSAAGRTGGTWGEPELQYYLHNPLRLRGNQVTLSVEALSRLAGSASLIERSVDQRRFTHQLLQEYFAAVYLSALPSSHMMLQDCLKYEAWDEAIVFLAELRRSIDHLVAQLVHLDPLLAARCAEVNLKGIKPVTLQLLVDQLVLC